MFVNMRNKVHATCKYWKNRRCHKSAAKCNFVHAYICQNDGRCHYDKCTHLHFKQEAPYIRNKWGFGGRRNFRFGGGRGGRNRRRSRSRSRSLSYGRGRSRSRSRSRGRSFRSFSRSRSRSLRGGSREGSFDRNFDRLHRSRSRGRMSRSISRGRMSRSRSRSRHVSLDRMSRSGSRGRGRSRNRRSVSMGRSGSPSPLRERGGLHNRSQSRSRGRSWSRSRSRSGSRGRLDRSRSGSRSRMGRSGMRRRGRSRSGSRQRVGRSRSESRGRGGRSRSGSRGRLGRSRSGSGGRRGGRSRSASRSRVSRSASRERNDSREGRSRSGSRNRGDDRSRSGSRSRSRRRDSRSGSRNRHWSRSQSARSRSPSPGGGRSVERFSHKSPDNRRDSPEGAGGISEATKSSYAAFATAYPTSSSYASDPNAYPSSYQNPSSFTPSSGFSGEHPYPSMTYSTTYPSTSTTYAATTYENNQQNTSYSSQFNETSFTGQSANQDANSPGSSSSHHNSESDGVEIGKGDETILGLEEVGEEVDDNYGSSMIRSVVESIGDALMQGIQRGKRLREVQKEVSSSKNLTDWELKCVLENPSKPIETMPPPVGQDSQLSGELARRNEMWTPALDRRSVVEAKQKMNQRTNDWEIETPYITRSSKASSGGHVVSRDVSKVIDTVAGLKMDLKLASQQKSTKTLFPSAVLEADTLSSVAQSYGSLEDNGKRMPPPKEFAMPDIPSNTSSSKKDGNELTKEEKKSQSKRGDESSSSKKSKEKKEKKKKKKKRKRTSSSDSDIASDTDDSEADKKKEAQERAKKEAKERIKLLEKKDELLNKVHLLVVEREKLERQRDEIIQNHKGDSKSLKSILEDNSGLMKEIHKQIFSMDEMISKVNSALGIADQGREKHRDLLGKTKSPPLAPPPPPSMPRHTSATPPVVRKVETKVDNESYRPLPIIKTYKEVSPPKAVQVKYVDQGMHWCKLCGIFCNNFTGYIEHLESPSHVESSKMEKKTWLAKAARPEKERIAPNAQTITEPLQGSEFLHSLLVFYCSLCDSFLRDKKEAIHHPESKLHVSMYKNHLAKNSMYEASYMKAKMGAYATFKINQEKQKRESLESLEREKGLKKEAKEKELAEMRHKALKESELGKDIKDREVGGDDGQYGSIRVASRGPSRKRDRDEDDRRWEDREERRWEERDRRKKEYEWREERGRREYEDRKGHERRKHERGRGEQSSLTDTPSPSPQYTVKRESSSVGKSSESERSSEKNDDNEKEPRDENQSTSTMSTKPKLPLIGKMPFFKKKGSALQMKEKMEKLYDLMELEGKGLKHILEEDMDMDDKEQTEVLLSFPPESDVKLEVEKPIRRSEEEKTIRKLEEEKLARKLEEEKVARKLEEEKLVRKLEEEKLVRKFEEEKLARKLEEEKSIRKAEAAKALKKALEEEKTMRTFDLQVSDSPEEEEQERREAEGSPIKSIPLPPHFGCADERDDEDSGGNVMYSPTKAEMEEERLEKEDVEEVKENVDVGSDCSSSFGEPEILESKKVEEEEEVVKEEEQPEESQHSQPTGKRGKGRGRGRSRGRGRGKGRGKYRTTSSDVEEKEAKSEEEQGGEEEQRGEEEQGGEDEQGKDEQDEHEQGGGTGSEVEGDEELEIETICRSGKIRGRSGRESQAAKQALLKEVATPTRRSRRQSARLAAREEERDVEQETEQQEQEESETPLDSMEEEVSETYTSVVTSDFSAVEEPMQEDGSAFYQPEEITMPSVDSNMGMEDHAGRMDMNSVTAMSLHADPLNATGMGPCTIMPATSIGMTMDPAAAVFPAVHMGATESSCIVPEDPLFPPGTEPNMAEEKDDLDEVPMDTEEEPQEPYIGDISDTLKHIGQSDHFDKLEEMKLLGIDIDDVAATSSME
ncbi:uncharacterized protein LOC143018558 isoform X1 [Oratosquilla oratoria]|uniref:uncharacterized protein LOC143018558 isoform X1 n=1 Tax=Oratosquilla oratoria TaxID=337810 RepID=UPI003F767A42